MNTSILKKCIAELQKGNPDLSYLRGMLETLLEMQGEGSLEKTTAIHSMDMRPQQNYLDPRLVPLAGPIDKSPEGMAVDAALATLQGVKPRPETLTIEKNTILN